MLFGQIWSKINKQIKIVPFFPCETDHQGFYRKYDLIIRTPKMLSINTVYTEKVKSMNYNIIYNINSYC